MIQKQTKQETKKKKGSRFIVEPQGVTKTESGVEALSKESFGKHGEKK
jgi:hypothetical protein